MSILHHIHDNDINYVTMKSAIHSHLNCSKLPFGCWNTIPQMQSRLSGYIKHLQGELTAASVWKLRICELGPNGGRWTQLVLSAFKEYSWPTALTYYLLGSEAEFKLTLRDAIRPLIDVPVLLGCDLRVPTHKKERLLTDVRFETCISDWLLALDGNGKAFTPRIDMFLAFDSIKHLSPQRQLDSLLSIKHCIVGNGTLYCNIKYHDHEEFDNAVYRLGFTDIYPPVYNPSDGCIYYAMSCV